MVNDIAAQDFRSLGKMAIPHKRAAYSDRTAWLMAILSELAYLPLDEEKEGTILTLAEELAHLTNTKNIQQKLAAFSTLLSHDETKKNEILRTALQLGDLHLLTVLYDFKTNTQGFIAYKKPAHHQPGMIVIVFRGTQQLQDWYTNLHAETQSIRPIENQADNTVSGHMHEGFQKAYLSVDEQIRNALKGYE